MSSFFSRLSYSFGNEDWRTEQKALKLQMKDRVLCVTGSGDRPLNLLTEACREIVAIDANPIQNELLKLKMAAIEELSYENYLRFLGAEKGPIERMQDWEKIKKHLGKASIEFWQEHLDWINKGILYQGAVEKLCGVLAWTISLLRGKKVEQLFRIDNLEQQREFVNMHWNTFLWKKSLDFVLNPSLTRPFVRDPGLYEHVPSSFKVGKYLYQRINRYLQTHLAKESPLLSLILLGVVPQEIYPPYLKNEERLKIKSRMNCITIENNDLIAYLQSQDNNSFDCFSISDVASYLSQQDFVHLMRLIHQKAKPGARFCIRQFLSNHQIPLPLAQHFRRDHQLEEKLTDEDRCFCYRFMVGEIQK